MELPVPLIDDQLERDMIGAVLAAPHLADTVAAASTDAFFGARLKDAHAAIIQAYAAGIDPTFAEVRNRMRASGDVGDDLNSWLTDLTGSTAILPLDVTRGMARLEDLALKRRVLSATSTIQATVVDPTSSGTDCLGALDNAALNVHGSVGLDAAALGGWAAAQSTLDYIEAAGRRSGLHGLSTGSKDLDDVLQGMRAGQLIAVGARPGIGKSVVAVDLARAALAQNAGVILFCLEMPHQEVMARLLAAETRINLSKLLTGNLQADEWSRLSAVMGQLPWDNLTIVDKAGVTVTQVSTLIRQQCRAWDAQGVEERLAVVDYLQIMGEEQQRRRDVTKQQALGAMSVGLKNCARDNELPLVVLAQLGRGAASRPPVLSDFRESGDIEANVDIAILLHRPDAEDPEERPGEADFHIAKNRNGPSRVVTRAAQLHYARFVDMAS